MYNVYMYVRVARLSFFSQYSILRFVKYKISINKYFLMKCLNLKIHLF